MKQIGTRASLKQHVITLSLNRDYIARIDKENFFPLP